METSAREPSAVEPLFDRLGGAAVIGRIVARFYERVAEDARLRPLYPDELAPARERLAAFFEQWTGGPRRYEELRGHPKLRLRHLRFGIGAEERDAWMRAMTAAVHDEHLDGTVEAEFLDACGKTASFLVNRGGLAISGH